MGVGVVCAGILGLAGGIPRTRRPRVRRRRRARPSSTPSRSPTTAAIRSGWRKPGTSSATSWWAVGRAPRRRSAASRCPTAAATARASRARTATARSSTARATPTARARTSASATCRPAPRAAAITTAPRSRVRTAPPTARRGRPARPGSARGSARAAACACASAGPACPGAGAVCDTGSPGQCQSLRLLRRRRLPVPGGRTVRLAAHTGRDDVALHARRVGRRLLGTHGMHARREHAHLRHGSVWDAGPARVQWRIQGRDAVRGHVGQRHDADRLLRRQPRQRVQPAGRRAVVRHGRHLRAQRPGGRRRRRLHRRRPERDVSGPARGDRRPATAAPTPTATASPAPARTRSAPTRSCVVQCMDPCDACTANANAPGLNCAANQDLYCCNATVASPDLGNSCNKGSWTCFSDGDCLSGTCQGNVCAPANDVCSAGTCPGGPPAANYSCQAVSGLGDLCLPPADCCGAYNPNWIAAATTAGGGAQPYATTFNQACPSAYAFQYDDIVSSFQCRSTGSAGRLRGELLRARNRSPGKDGCSGAATFASVACRAGRIATRIDDTVTFPKMRRKLGKLAAKIQKKVGQAETFAGRGKRGKVRPCTDAGAPRLADDGEAARDEEGAAEDSRRRARAIARARDDAAGGPGRAAPGAAVALDREPPRAAKVGRTMEPDLSRLGDARIFIDRAAYADPDAWHAAAERLRRHDPLPLVAVDGFVPVPRRHAPRRRRRRSSATTRSSGTRSDSVLLPRAQVERNRQLGIDIKTLIHMDGAEHRATASAHQRLVQAGEPAEGARQRVPVARAALRRPHARARRRSATSSATSRSTTRCTSS